MKYIEIYVTVECTEENGGRAVGKIVGTLKKLPDGCHVTLKTTSLYVYDIINDGRPWKWAENGWITEVRKAPINAKSEWMAFIEQHARFASFTIEMI